MPSEEPSTEEKINQTVSSLEAVLNNVDNTLIEPAKQKFCGSNTPAPAPAPPGETPGAVETPGAAAGQPAPAPENQTKDTSQTAGRRSRRRRQKKSAKKSKKGGRSRKNCGSKNRRKLSRRR